MIKHLTLTTGKACLALTFFLLLPTKANSDCIQKQEFSGAKIADFSSAPNAWTHSIGPSGNWLASSKAGHDEFESFDYFFNDASLKSVLDFSSPRHPVVSVRVRKKPSGAKMNSALLRVDLFDKAGSTDDETMKNKFVLTEEYQTFTYDFSGHFINKYGCVKGCGTLDSTKIQGIKFYVNPGFFSFPITVGAQKYSDPYIGDIDFDMLFVGDEASCASAKIRRLSINVGYENVMYSQGVVNLSLPGLGEKPLHISVLNLSGQVAEEKTYFSSGHDAVKIDLSALQRGLYWLRMDYGSIHLVRKVSILAI
jgi:hypothetical protein